MAEIIKGMYHGKPLLGENGLLTGLVKDLTQIALQGEMDAHIAENSLEEGGNRRNGIKAKTVRSPAGAFELEVPRDRNSTFEPQLVKKRQTVLSDELDNKILALYGIGTSYDDISSHLHEVYGVEVSAATISAVTDRIIPQIAEWRSRPLESVYVTVFLDGMYFKVKQDGKVLTKVLYNIMGINQSGIKEILD
jgi:transposase-like protein